MGLVAQVGLRDIFLFQPLKLYLYGGYVPCILAITDNLRAQVHMLRQAALEEAVIHHLSHVDGSADGSSTSLYGQLLGTSVIVHHDSRSISHDRLLTDQYSVRRNISSTHLSRSPLRLPWFFRQAIHLRQREYDVRQNATKAEDP